MLREFEINYYFFCVFRFNGLEEDREKGDKGEGDKEKAGFEGDEEKGVSF